MHGCTADGASEQSGSHVEPDAVFLPIGGQFLLRKVKRPGIDQREVVRFLPRTGNNVVLTANRQTGSVDILAVLRFVKSIDAEIDVILDERAEHAKAPPFTPEFRSYPAPTELSLDLAERMRM